MNDRQWAARCYKERYDVDDVLAVGLVGKLRTVHPHRDRGLDVRLPIFYVGEMDLLCSGSVGVDGGRGGDFLVDRDSTIES